MPSELDFFTFVYTRQFIWYNRFVLKQPPPWTNDSILQTYKIINMYRELDKCTIYLINTLKTVKSREVLLLNIIFYRFFNTCNLFEDLGISVITVLNEAVKKELLLKFAALRERKPIFNNAYLISSGGRGVKYCSILNNLAALDIDRLIGEIDHSKSPEDSLRALTQIPMVGPFLAGEFWADLTYFRWFKQGWSDNDFVSIGPGAKWGLEILYGLLSKKEQDEKLNDLYNAQKMILPSIHQTMGKTISWSEIAYKQAYSNYPFLSLTNIEGALCEFRKYWRLGQGKGKKRYYYFSKCDIHT